MYYLFFSCYIVCSSDDMMVMGSGMVHETTWHTEPGNPAYFDSSFDAFEVVKQINKNEKLINGMVET